MNIFEHARSILVETRCLFDMRSFSKQSFTANGQEVLTGIFERINVQVCTELLFMIRTRKSKNSQSSLVHVHLLFKNPKSHGLSNTFKAIKSCFIMIRILESLKTCHIFSTWFNHFPKILILFESSFWQASFDYEKSIIDQCRAFIFHYRLLITNSWWLGSKRLKIFRIHIRRMPVLKKDNT